MVLMSVFILLALFTLIQAFRAEHIQFGREPLFFDGYTRTDKTMRAWALSYSAVSFIIAALFFFGGTWPLDMSYHHQYRVTGTITHIASRLKEHGSGMSQRYVFSIKGLPSGYGVDDTRAALKKVGDHVDLMCQKEYVYNSISGYSCNWHES